MSRPDDETERKFLRSFARGLGVEELSAEVLATSLGLDELTPEKLDAWFAEQVASAREPDDDGARVVQVDPAAERRSDPPKRPALPASTRRRTRRSRDR